MGRVSGEELAERAGNLRAQPASLGFQCFQYLRKTFVYIYKISQATTCSYTVVGRGRIEKGGGREGRTSLEAPPKPVGRKWTLNIDKEMGKEKEDSAFPTRLCFFLKKKGRCRPFPPPSTLGCGARTQTAPSKSRWVQVAH